MPKFKRKPRGLYSTKVLEPCSLDKDYVWIMYRGERKRVHKQLLRWRAKGKPLSPHFKTPKQLTLPDALVQLNAERKELRNNPASIKKKLFE